MQGFSPGLVDPIPPINLEMLRGEGPGVVVALFHAPRSSLVIAVAEGGWRSYGFATGTWQATGVLLPEYTAGGNPSWHLTLAVVLVGNSNGPGVR